MKSLFSAYDLKYYFNERKKVYLLVLMCLIVGVIIGVFVVVSNDAYLSLLKAEDKVLYDFINGKASFSKQVARMVSKFVLPLIILFVCNISYYTSFISLLFVTYEGALFFMYVFILS